MGNEGIKNRGDRESDLDQIKVSMHACHPPQYRFEFRSLNPMEEKKNKAPFFCLFYLHKNIINSFLFLTTLEIQEIIEVKGSLCLTTLDIIKQFNSKV
jgi:hypothetical protein